MNKILLAIGLAAGLLTAGVAFAEPYTDYTPVKGAWHVTTIKVDPNHIDDYVTGLKKTWATGEELAKKHGVIDQYMILLKLNSGAGANVQLIEHYPSLANLEPDKARDQALQKEGEAMVSKDNMTKSVGEFDKYRTFVSDEFWTSLEFTK
jgi:hypothetical protein